VRANTNNAQNRQPANPDYVTKNLEKNLQNKSSKKSPKQTLFPKNLQTNFQNNPNRGKTGGKIGGKDGGNIREEKWKIEGDKSKAQHRRTKFEGKGRRTIWREMPSMILPSGSGFPKQIHKNYLEL